MNTSEWLNENKEIATYEFNTRDAARRDIFRLGNSLGDDCVGALLANAMDGGGNRANFVIRLGEGVSIDGLRELMIFLEILESGAQLKDGLDGLDIVVQGGKNISYSQLDEMMVSEYY